jgi:hypothetical protein
MSSNKNPVLMVRLFLVIALLALGACSTLNRSDFTLLTATSDQQVRVAQQQWHVQQGTKDYSVDVIVERHAAHWRWIMLNQLGQRLATVESNSSGVTIERHHSHPANQLLPELLQAWQFSYWPLTDLQEANPRWLFVDRGGRREASFSGILRATIEYPPITDQVNLWQDSLSYNTQEFRLLIHSKPLN